MRAEQARRLRIGLRVVAPFSNSHRLADIVEVDWPRFRVTTILANGETRTQWNRYRALHFKADYVRRYGAANLKLFGKINWKVYIPGGKETAAYLIGRIKAETKTEALREAARRWPYHVRHMWAVNPRTEKAVAELPKVEPPAELEAAIAKHTNHNEQ